MNIALWELILVSVIGTLMVLVLCNRFLGVWACNIMGWHLEPKTKGFDGCSLNGTCPRCNKKVLQDSQGNWF